MEALLDSLIVWFRTWPTSQLMIGTRWAWPIVESFHFFGLCLLVGIIGLFDLRLMGFAPEIRPSALHRLVPWAVGGFFINVCTGLMFLSATPDQYLGGNSAFEIKMVLMGLAGLNVGIFYLTTFPGVKLLGPGDRPPLAARIIGGVSLTLWVGEMICGRMITFYRP